MSHYVYALRDPETDEIRYVGKTNKLIIRYRKHLYTSKRGATHKDCWIRVLASLGLRPKIVVLFACKTEEAASLLERLSIKMLRSGGLDLTNLTDGGEGTTGWKPSIEWRQNVSRRNSGPNNYNYGKRATTESRHKLSHAHKHSEKAKAHRARVADKRCRRLIDEDGRVFRSAKEAAEFHKINISTLRSHFIPGRKPRKKYPSFSYLN